MRSTPVSRKPAESPLNGQQWRNRRALLPMFSIQSSMSVSFVNSKLLRLVLVEDSATKTEQRFVFAAGFPSLSVHTSAEGLPASLAHSKLLEGILPHDRELIAGVAERRNILGDVIIRGGERAAHLFLLNSGRAKYYKLTKNGQELLLWWLSPGDVFGLATLLRDPPDYIGSAEAIKPCELLVWKHSAIQELLIRYPRLSQNALRITLRYLSSYADRHAAIVTETAEQRLAHTLIRLANKSGHPHSTDVEVEITNEQLGQLADVGLFTATRFLSAWGRNGAITKKRGKVLIQAPEKLPVD